MIKKEVFSMLKKVKKVFCRCKAFVVGALATVSACAMTVVASASEMSDPVTMKSMLSDAGDTLISSFNDLVQTMIPIIMGIIGGGLVVFGLMAMFKLAKKIFNKVTG